MSDDIRVSYALLLWSWSCKHDVDVKFVLGVSHCVTLNVPAAVNSDSHQIITCNHKDFSYTFIPCADICNTSQLPSLKGYSLIFRPSRSCEYCDLYSRHLKSTQHVLLKQFVIIALHCISAVSACTENQGISPFCICMLKSFSELKQILIFTPNFHLLIWAGYFLHSHHRLPPCSQTSCHFKSCKQYLCFVLQVILNQKKTWQFFWAASTSL